MSVEQHDQYLAEWESRQEIAEAMVPIIGKIYRSSGVVLKIYGRTLINASPVTILKLHRYVRQFEKTDLSIHDSFKVLIALQKMKLGPVRIDLGLLVTQYNNETRDVALEDFLAEKLGNGIRLIQEQSASTPGAIWLWPNWPFISTPTHRTNRFWK